MIDDRVCGDIYRFDLMGKFITKDTRASQIYRMRVLSNVKSIINSEWFGGNLVMIMGEFF